MNPDSIKQLSQAILSFRDARDWEQFHTSKNLVAALNVESAELLELFLWSNKPRKPEEVTSEVADVFSYLLLFCETNNIDLGQALLDKLAKNEQKYPVEKSKGNAIKYTDL